MMQPKKIIISLLVVLLLALGTLTAFAAANADPAFDIAVSASADTAMVGEDGVINVVKGSKLNFSVKADAWKGLGIDLLAIEVVFDPTVLAIDTESIVADTTVSGDNWVDVNTTQLSDGKISYEAWSYKGTATELLKFTATVISEHGDATVGFNMHALHTDWSDNITQHLVDLSVHQYGDVQTDNPTCLEPGRKYRACADETCGKEFVTEILDPLGHAYGAWAVTTDPTVDAVGTLTKTCANDASHTVPFELPMLSTENGYTYAVTKPETCEGTGVGTFTYEKDGQSFKFDVERAALGHKYGEWVVTTIPTENKAGALTKTCENDASHKIPFELPALSTENGYKYEITKPETCEIPGMGQYTYTKDGQTFKFDVERAALGHKYGAWVQTTAPTVSATGLLTRTCGNDASHQDTYVLPTLSTENGYIYAITKPETCEGTGVGTFTYNIDGQSFAFNVERAAHGHNYGAWVVTTKPTVNKVGVLTKTCSHDATHTVPFELPMLSTENGYEYEITAHETCETTGMGKFTYTKDGQTFTFDVERAELGHAYGEWTLTTAPTVDAAGLLSRVCEHDASHVDEFTLPALSIANGYEYEITTPETCETTGMGKFTYTKDGKAFTFDVERAELGHDYGAWVVTTAPTETTKGLLTKTCSHDATHTVTADLPIMSAENGATYVVVTPETCETAGVGKYTYEMDGQFFEFEVEIKPYGHKYGAWTLTTAPTVDAAGLLSRVCEHDASHVDEFTLPALSTENGYTYEITAHETCETTGMGKFTYTKDEQTFMFDVVRAELGHAYGAWVVTTAPTVDAAGVLTKTCTHDATHTETFALPALSIENGYTYAITTPELCEATGVGTFTYEKDGQTFTFDVERAVLGHNYGAWVVTTAPTVDAAGVLTKTCTHDATHTETFELPALSTENGYTCAITTPETCTEKGVDTYTYVKDGQTFTFDVERAALGHDETGPEPTCTTDKVCMREDCGVVLLERLGHDYSGPDATCTTDEVCMREDCGEVLVAKYGHDYSGPDATCTTDEVCMREGCGVVLVEKLGHTFGDWVVEQEPTMSATGIEAKTCSVCGAREKQDIPEKSSTWVVVLSVSLVVVLGGGGFAAYWFLIKNKKVPTGSDETTNEDSTDEKTEE